MLWSHLVRSKRKIITTTKAVDCFRQSHFVTPSPIAVIRPFVKKKWNKDRTFLNKALLKFNETAEAAGHHEDFLGYRKQIRTYLGHDFLEKSLSKMVFL
ncbi:hypothetical protein BD408DRAFT_416562 [Parasitella parasitica]|nr:hypothetical protein BD408DRAFT_416562 [Parasitella parasitica]